MRTEKLEKENRLKLRLATQRSNGEPCPPRIRIDNSMTIAIGLLNSKNTVANRKASVICVAADSQTTCGNIKRSDAQKITRLTFGNLLKSRENAILAQAGNSDNANRTLEILMELAKSETLSHKRSVADLVERAMLQFKREMRRKQGNCSMEKLRDFILNYEQNFQLIITHFFDHEPYFYIADFWTGAANRENSHFAAIGTGAEVASYIINEFYTPEMPLQSVYAAAIYTIEEVKKHDTYCSGETRAAFLIGEGDGSMYFFMPKNLAESYSKMVAKLNPQVRQKHIENMEIFLSEIAKKTESKFDLEVKKSAV